jgi:hypothetical protein
VKQAVIYFWFTLSCVWLTGLMLLLLLLLVVVVDVLFLSVSPVHTLSFDARHNT